MSNTIMSYFCNIARLMLTIRHMQSTKSRVLMNSDVKYGYSIITHFLVVHTLPHSILHSCASRKKQTDGHCTRERLQNQSRGRESNWVWHEQRDAYHRKHTQRRVKEERWSHYLFKSTWKLLKSILSQTVCVPKKFPEFFIPKLFS